MTIRGRIYRGEVRQAFPTYEHPDPAAHAAEDPAGFLHKWMQPQYPYPEDYSGGMPLTVGQHWSGSPAIIPERFLEPMLTQPQPGVPMGKREQTAVSRHEASETLDWREHHEAVKKHQTYAERANREGVNIYHDLSGGDPDRPGKARKYKMAVVWEGQHHERSETGTNYEDEHNIPMGEHVTITGARLYVPKSGTTHDWHARHPSVFTPEERRSAHADVVARSTYSHINPESSIPWSRVQFANAQEMLVGRHSGGR